MKTIFRIFIVLGLILANPALSTFGQVRINNDGTAAASCAMLDVKSSSGGMLVPRMTEAQRTAIASPATGLLVFQTDGNPGFFYYTGTAWNFLGLDKSTWENESGGNVIDIDGNVYPTIKRLNQEWMAENLRVTHYQNGDPITLDPNPATWPNSWYDNGKFCWYGNDETTNKPLYGALYNYFAAVDGRNICPQGWHLPTDDEWTTMIYDLYSGMHFKASRLWFSSPNVWSDNEWGFSVLPAGYRDESGNYLNVQADGILWTATAACPACVSAYVRRFNYNNNNAVPDPFWAEAGLSVRCVKN